MVKNQKKIEQIAGIVLIIAIVLGCGLVLKPFTVSILWAAILCFATWPVYELLLKGMPKKPSIAAALMSIVILLVLFVPFFIVGMQFTDSVKSAMDWLDSHRQTGFPMPPEWIGKIPLVGGKISEYLTKFATNSDAAINSLKPYFQKAGTWMLAHSLDFAQGVFQLALSIFITFFLYRDGKEIVAQMEKGFERISGEYAQHLFEVVKSTVQSVVYGIIGTAIVQGVVASIGFIIAGVPSPVLLGLFTFLLSFLPFGPVFIWLGASIWLFSNGHNAWGIFMLIYGMFVISSIDNVVRTMIISRGSKISFIVMFIGILGGIATFGLIGVFIGPTLLTVGVGLIKEILSRRTYINAEPKENAEIILPKNVDKEKI